MEVGIDSCTETPHGRAARDFGCRGVPAGEWASPKARPDPVGVALRRKRLPPIGLGRMEGIPWTRPRKAGPHVRNA